jgi:8-oxo-dGTP pyrophosphatase MutT (NUDIX family)
VPASERQGIDLARLVGVLEASRRDLGSSPPEPVDELTGVDAAVTSTLVRSAVLVAAFEEAGESRIILTRRAGHLRRHRGEVALPGGRIEPDETPLDAAIREADEEVGLDPRDVTPVGWLRPLVTFASGSLIHPFVATLPARPQLVVQPSEVERAFDVSIRDLLADGTFREERWRRPTPRAGADAEGAFAIFFFEVDGETIWGATARILTELCCLVTGVPSRPR